MKVLIGASHWRMPVLREFGEALSRCGVEYRLVNDAEIIDGYPSRKIKRWLRSKRRFNQLLSEFKPDVIFSDRQRHFSVAALEAKIPLVVWMRGDFWEEISFIRMSSHKSFPLSMVLDAWEKLAMKSVSDARIVMPICKYAEGILQKRLPDKPSYILDHGIEPSKWFPENGIKLKHPCVGLVQTSENWKKTSEMLVLKNVLKKLPDVTWYWVGDGPNTATILDELQKYPNFKWLGKLSHPDKIRQFLTEIDIYALISGIDLMPMSLKEAMMMKKPSIATDVGGVHEIVENGKNALLVMQGSSDDIVEKIQYILDDSDRAKQIGECAREFTERTSSWDNIAQGFTKYVKAELHID